MSEERVNAIYAHVANEIESKKFDAGLMARATANANGDIGMRDSLHLQLRVEAYVKAELAAQEKQRDAEFAVAQEARRVAEREERLKAKERLLMSADSAKQLADFSNAVDLIIATKLRRHPLLAALLFWIITPLVLSCFLVIATAVFGYTIPQDILGLFGFIYVVTCWIVLFRAIYQHLKRNSSIRGANEKIKENKALVVAMSRAGSKEADELLVKYKAVEGK